MIAVSYSSKSIPVLKYSSLNSSMNNFGIVAIFDAKHSGNTPRSKYTSASFLTGRIERNFYWKFWTSEKSSF